ncbi:2Fe-2S iron-sulfur cluster-binding protein [Gordonia sp. (in: high G+C Gram-positive bacteria)]|uniref:2Fe-2S iron-sulfur cluster-binding protein n=1 Tax=Gordonia sp. (in: high G+C Gram-positive bacteria) TaxID=84139 RepID=UPI0016A6B61A|nr:2Fe-2S iron-sulfur cluster-binding protein [Gordonia sp. (in: high G+C Gram-positive bacteria)]NLG47951.1 2Fe-2S iron-sulfur cluster binding domain-containing protein [Gordonia sp. (in: high G+C Gram-positive bacteria)]
MPTITFISPDGSKHEVEAKVGASVMETAVKLGVPGVVGECGGGLSCATCHVFVEPHQIELTGVAEDFEEEMLEDAVTPATECSRLSCQIRMTDELDGLILTIAPEQ